MVATIYGNIGLCHQSMDDHQKALHCLQLALDLREKALGEMHPSVAYTLFSMSASLALLSRWEDAERCCKRAVAIAKEVHGLHHATTALYEERLEAILGNVGG
jgi:tetratricopeptide (TPR) repeat protein